MAICEITKTKDCAVQDLANSKVTALQSARSARESIEKAREGGPEGYDVTNYSELGKMAEAYESQAEKLQAQINSQGCTPCWNKITP
jgi:hypothetical protein